MVQLQIGLASPTGQLRISNFPVFLRNRWFIQIRSDRLQPHPHFSRDTFYEFAFFSKKRITTSIYQWDNTSYPFSLEMWTTIVPFIFNFINRSITSAYQTPGIFIILRIMNIPGVFPADKMFLFTTLKIKWPTVVHALGMRYCPIDIYIVSFFFHPTKSYVFFYTRSNKFDRPISSLLITRFFSPTPGMNARGHAVPKRHRKK